MALTSYFFSVFLSTPSARRATQYTQPLHDVWQISIHALREEGDGHLSAEKGDRMYFYPRPPRGGRPTRTSSWSAAGQFLSTPSARRATRRWTMTSPRKIFLSTPSARRATLRSAHAEARRDKISIHALREEGDHSNQQRLRGRGISIHALREEGDTGTLSRDPSLKDFYPRPPRGGRLCRARQAGRKSGYFYPRPPRGGRLRVAAPGVLLFLISIHALREEGDHPLSVFFAGSHIISIHALREEGDRRHPAVKRSTRKFLSTPSARRATSWKRSGFCKD